MFEDSTASKLFGEKIELLGDQPEKLKKFTDRVWALYELKAISEDGAYPTFKVTLDDIIRLMKNL